MQINNKDNILAKLSAGEQVASNAALKLIGRELIPAANRAALAMKKGGTMQAQHFKHGTLDKKGIQPKYALPKKHPKPKPKSAAGFPDKKEMPNDPDMKMEGMEGYANGTGSIAGVQRIGNSYGRPKGYQAPSLPQGQWPSGYVTHQIPQAEQDMPGASDYQDVSGQNWQIYAPKDEYTHTRGFKDGTQANQGVQPSPQPRPQPKPTAQGPNRQAETAPTLEQAKRNYELQFGKVKGYANGVLDEYGVQPGRQVVAAGPLQGPQSRALVPQGLPDNGYRPNWTYGNGAPEIPDPTYAEQAKARARAYQARTAYTPPAGSAPAPAAGGAAGKLGGLLRGLGTLGGLATGYQAARAILPENPNHPIEDFVNQVGSKVGDYVGGLFGGGSQAAQPQGLPQNPAQPTQAKPKYQPLITGSTSAGMGNPGIPTTVNPNINTTYFTNPDGTGSGQITAPNMARRMGDGKGSFNAMHLESPNAPAIQGLPQQAPRPVAQQQAPDYSGQIEDLVQQLNTQPLGGGFDEAIAAKQKREAAKNGLAAILNAQQNTQQYAVNQNRNAIDQGQFNDKLAFDQRQNDFANSLAMNELGAKSQAAQAQGRLEAQKLQLEQQKALKDVSEGQLLEALSHGLATGKAEHPQFKQLMDFYMQRFGKNPAEMLGLAAGG